ncbi:Dyp-type peroxidase [Serinibacter arcticus]|nr:Dyp-type peroxidase [Serinibacter arcticus]
MLLGSAVAGWGAALALGTDAVASGATPTPPQPSPPEDAHGSVTIPFHGPHQAGIAIEPQARSTFLALDLLPATDRDGLRRLLRLLSDDAARLTQGRPALADSEPELAARPARLTVTFSVGPAVVALAGRAVPDWLAPLPPFGIDRLQEAWSGGDLVLEVASDDDLTLAHAVRMLLKDARAFATLRWVQAGFRHAHGSQPSGTTMRNLFGQKDGTVNLVPGTADFESLVWRTDGWLAGGSSLVIRRVAMDLDTWDELDRPGREASVGRTLATGAPLTGTAEHDEPDLEALDAVGFPVISDVAHLRRARSEDPTQRFFRRGYNYDDPPSAGAISNAGLIFTSYQADPVRQFVPIQQRLDELDLLNEWTTPIGSAVLAVLPGCAEGGYVGETLLV